MKKTMNQNRTESNKRSFVAKWASAIVCFALMLTGISAFGAPAANDNFVSATVIPPSPPATVTGNNIDATFESGEPLHSDFPNAAQIGTNSIWWSWTPDASGATTIDTMNSGFDTELAVYTGASVGALTPVAKNEDDSGLAQGWSRVTFNAVSGTVYHIAVSGFENIGGAVNLNFSSGGTVVTGLVLTVSTTGSGTATQDPAQPAGGYASNAVVTVVATPNGTNTFLGWTGTDQNDTNLTNTVTMTSNKSVTAAFTGTGGGGATNLVLTIQKIGSGTVTKSPNKPRYTEGEVVTVIARPSGSRTFVGWTGTDEANTDRTNHVTMTTDKTIIATFSGAPGPGPGPEPGEFDGVVGTYNGLFFDPEVSTNCSGYFTVKVNKNGKFTVNLKKAGKTISGSGTINSATGAGIATISKGTNVTTVAINTDITGADPAITGIVTTPDCVSTLEGDRAVFTSKNPAPIQGLFTFVLPRNVTTGGQTNDVIITNIVVVTNDPGTTNETVVTNTTFTTNSVVSTNDIVTNPGHSFATLSINKTGKVKIKGTMADGTKFSQNTAISTNGEVPLFASFFKGRGLLLGWLNVTLTDVAGDPINWRRPAGETRFPLGFDADIVAFGSRFLKDINPFLALGTNAVIVIDRNPGILGSESRVIPVEFSNDNTLVEREGLVTNVTDTVSLKLQPSGLVKGKFTSTITGESTTLQGAMIQNTNAAFGYFLNDETSGSFELRNEPVVVPVVVP